MNPQRWTIIQELFNAALEQPPADRPEFLVRSCGDDEQLRLELESLLQAQAQLGEFLETPLYQPDDAATRSDPPVDHASDEAEQRLSLAKMIPDYGMIRTCGEGAFGRVWIVRDRADAYRAMKVVRFDRLVNLGVSQRERQALGHYCRNVPQHSNLMQVFHIGQTESVFYYTMELADDLGTGQPVRKQLPESYAPMTLHGVLARGRLNPDTAVEITLRLLKGAACLHQAALVHRDIKPANVVFVDRQVKLADISLVSIRESRMSVAGTPRYMPPDQLMDQTADTYALGKVLHEMMSGRNSSDFPHLPHAHLISSSRMDLSKLDSFLSRACAATARDRFASAADMIEALLQCRYPLHDSPLLELAQQEDGPAPALRQLQKAISGRQTMDSETTGGSHGSEADSRPIGGGDADGLWRVLGLILRMLPWIVVLILGYSLIHRLAR